ncbi:MAG: methyl-accepting chemotaxis protein [Rhodocyclaceae bacterium]|jgi:methyl-accepting chemotaxis protein|nr:methyl-accepting chemotaxis protein [Rhodocyclaceae bacterium]MCL4758716.1 methyl-accepting chemotaxis protein [Rhodocyclaceae bacterium]
MLAALQLRTKIVLLVVTTFVGLAALMAIGAAAVKEDLMEARKLQVVSMVQAATQIAAANHARAAAGELSEDEARARTLNAIEDMRYGGADGKAEYLYVLAPSGITVMHPIRKEWNGRDVSGEVRDGQGRYTLKDIIAAGNRGSGFVDTSFPRPGTKIPVDKLQYAAAFQPWGWVIGTGVYVDDVQAAARTRLLVDLAIGGGIMIVIILLGMLIATSVLRQIGGEPGDALALMDRAAAGDLTVEVGKVHPGSLLDGLARMLQSIRTLVAQIAQRAEQVKTTAERISNASHQVAQAAHQQADATSSMAAAIEEMTVSIDHISDSARETESNSSTAAALAESGESKVASATGEMHRIAQSVTDAAERIRSLESSANEISTIANVIKEIAAQTNLLALNAAIEAARAGEQGRGFAVVADEVRKLAERTSAATEEIGGMIGAIQDNTVSGVEAMDRAIPQVEHGVHLSQEAGQSLRDIRAGAGSTLERIREVAAATREQSLASNAIAKQVETIAQMVEETSVSMQQTASSAHELETVAKELGNVVARFRH